VAELALGYQGSVGALRQMDRKWAAKASQEELQELVDQWRNANPKIVRLWYDVEAAAIEAIENRTIVELQHGLKLIYDPGFLFIQLPSGRRLAYLRPELHPHDKFQGKTKITYEGLDTNYNWVRIDTYGGKLTENIVQAIARDCLRDAMLRLDAVGYKIAFHVHDEVVLDVPIGHGSIKHVNAIMSQPVNWAPDLPLIAEGFECTYYQKD
jgi:DNA polymerase